MAGGEVVILDRFRLARLGAQQRLVDHRVGDGRAQVALVAAQRRQCLLKLGGGSVLEQVAMGAAFQCLHDQLRVGVHREDQHLAATAEGA
ncbi:hypothetical protein D3C79_985290 [compost metagenome]